MSDQRFAALLGRQEQVLPKPERSSIFAIGFFSFNVMEAKGAPNTSGQVLLLSARSSRYDKAEVGQQAEVFFQNVSGQTSWHRPFRRFF